MYHSLHYADILNLRIDANGNLRGTIFDVIDYNPNDSNWIVQAARKHQESGNFQNYYVLIDVCIPKEEWLNY